MIHKLVLFLALASPSWQASVMRFSCSELVIDRIDPLVEPGKSPSAHMHQIVGGNAFAPEIASTDVSELATCTTCSFKEDRSNYWTANMFFQARNGSYMRVPQKPNRFFNGANAGVTVYYVAPYDGAKATAFKPGFRMLTGDLNLKNAEDMGRGNCFRCYTGPDFGGDIYAPCSDPERDSLYLPERMCPGGIRSNIEFPTCWDGVNLDSPDHKSHVAWPLRSFQANGDCPSTHPVKLPQIFLEIVWDTTIFNDPEEWPEEGQPFVLSYGDKVGYGQHADYIFGWEGDSLQRAIDAPGQDCFAARCPELTTQTFEDANSCSVSKTVDEEVDGWLDSLPGLSHMGDGGD